MSSRTSRTVSSSDTNMIIPPETYSKRAISRLKSKSLTEKDELKKLNLELRGYLQNVYRLEELNYRLQEEVDRAKENLPKLVDKSQLDIQLYETRAELEKSSNSSVELKLKIDENKSICRQLSQRIKFFQQESEFQKQKIHKLQQQLIEIESQKDYLINGARIALENVEHEKERQFKSEKDLENLRSTLTKCIAKNKSLEFETNTLNDEIEFRKAVFLEESNYLRSRFTGTILNGTELTNFYKNELAIAIRQIREDFMTLNEQQIKEYKELKEHELNFFTNLIKQQRIKQAQLGAVKDEESQALKELKINSNRLKEDQNLLLCQQNELVKKLANLEENFDDVKQKNNEKLDILLDQIEALKHTNHAITSELEFWDGYARAKLESEITAYRSLLNSQLKFIQSFTNSQLNTRNSPKPKIMQRSMVTEKIIDEDGNTITDRASPELRSRSSSSSRSSSLVRAYEAVALDYDDDQDISYSSSKAFATLARNMDTSQINSPDNTPIQ